MEKKHIPTSVLFLRQFKEMEKKHIPTSVLILGRVLRTVKPLIKIDSKMIDLRNDKLKE
jgi:hypothetical protein